MIEQQGLIAARLEDLGKKKARLQDLPLLQEISELREDYREVGLDLVKLLRFVDINANAVRKILKKFDERLGINLQIIMSAADQTTLILSFSRFSSMW